MKIEDLERITNHKTLSDHELLVEGAKGNIKLYTLIKDDIDIYFDLIEIQICPNTGTKQILPYENDAQWRYKRGSCKELPIPAIEELLLHRKLEGNNLAIAFPPPTPEHKLHSFKVLDTIHISDVYFNNRSVNKLATKQKTNTKKSKRAENPVKQAIYLAIANLGDDPTVETIYKWIKSEVANSSNTDPCLTNIEFSGTTPIHSAGKTDVVIKYSLNGTIRPNTKKTFQNKVGKCKGSSN